MELKEELIYEFKYKSLFSEYLPQSFSITPMNGFDIFSIQLKENTDSIEPYSFSMSNFSINNKRRILYLPEITSYITLINYMLENRIINELCEISNESHHSYSKIIQMVDGEEAFIEHDGNYGEPPSYEVYQTEEDTLNGTVDDDPSNYTENIIEKLIRAKGAKGILSLDISNCYKSIYTHYLACIKIGLSEAKNQYMLAKKKKADCACEGSEKRGLQRNLFSKLTSYIT